MTEAHINETILKTNLALQTLQTTRCDETAARASRELAERHLPALEGAGEFYGPIAVEARALHRLALAERLRAKLART